MHREGYLSYYHDGQSHRVDASNADEVGQMLIDENIASVGARYQDTGITDLPGGDPMAYLSTYTYPVQFLGRGMIQVVTDVRIPTPIEVLKALSCYEYQSCEHDTWEASAAHAFCEALRHVTISRLPGCEAAPWAWND